MLPGESLDDLRAAAMAVHIAEAPDVHEDVEAQGGAGTKGAKKLVVAAAMAGAEVDDFGDARGGEGCGEVANLAVGVVAGRVKECGGELDLERFGALDEVDHCVGWGIGRERCEDFGGGLGELGLGLRDVGVGLGVFHKCGCGADVAREEGGGFGSERGCGVVSERREFVNEGLGGGSVEIPGGRGGSFAEFFAEQANLGKRVRQKARDLDFKGAGADDLAEGSVGGEGKQVASDVKGAGAEGAFVRLRLEAVRGRDAAMEQIEDGGADALVRSEKAADGFGIELGGGSVSTEAGSIKAGFEEILVAGGAFLAVPARLVDEDDGGQQAEALDGEGDMGQVGDGAVAILEIECIEELLGALGANFRQGFAHGERRPGVLCHGESEDFRVGAVDGKDLSLVPGFGSD